MQPTQQYIEIEMQTETEIDQYCQQLDIQQQTDLIDHDQQQSAIICNSTEVLLQHPKYRYLLYPYIYQGYRINYTLQNCLFSLFQIHNELGNIWTHLIPAIISWISIIHIQQIIDHQLSTQTNRIVLQLDNIQITQMNQKLATHPILINIICSLICFLFSSLYHTLNCISQSAHNCLLKCDMIGILFVMAGSAYPINYYAYQFQNQKQTIICSMLLLILLFFTVLMINFIRLRLYLLLGFVGLLFILYYQIFVMCFEFFKVTFWYVVWQSVCYGLGFTIYQLRVPEALFKNRFDLYGHSHQIWHILVMVGQLVAFKGTLAFYQYRYDQQFL